MLDASRRGTDRGIGNAQELAKLFALKERTRRRNEMEEFVKTKARMDRYMGLASMDAPALQKIGWEGLTAMSEKDPSLFGGKRDFLAMFSQNQGNDALETWRKEVSGLMKQYANKEIDAQAYGAALKIKQSELDLFPSRGTKDDIDIMKRETDENIARINLINKAMETKAIQRMQRPETGPPEQGVYGRSEYELAPEKPEEEKTIPQLEAGAFVKWMDGKPLTPQEQIIIDKKTKPTGKTPDQIKKDARAKMEVWVENFKTFMSRPPSKQEIRAHMLTDPWGFLAPAETEKEFEVGETKEVDGKTYKYLGKDKWQEQ